MALVRNITPDALRLFSPDAPLVNPGDTVEIRDERCIGLAWPTATWEVVEPPEGCDITEGDDFILFSPSTAEPTNTEGDDS